MKRNLQLAKNKMLVLGLLLISTASQLMANTTQQTREAKVNIPVNPGMEIAMIASSTDVFISSWDKNEVALVAKILYKGKENERMTEFLENFEEEVQDGIEQSSGYLKISADLDVPNKVQIGSKHVGVIVSFDKDELALTYELKVPSGNALYVKNSYEKLMVDGNYSNKVKINHYSGDFRGGNFTDLELELKYGHATIKECKTASMELYEQELEVNTLRQARIDAKYSTIEVITGGQLDVEGYESELALSSLDILEGELKYSEVEVETNLEEMTLSSIYESKIAIKEIARIRIGESKYSKIRVNAVRTLELPSSYEDELMIGFLGSATLDAKYLKMEIDKLGRDLKVNAYEGEIRINELSEGSESIFYDGKYNNFILKDINHNLVIDADIQYGDIDFDESLIKRTIYIKEDSKLQMKAQTNNQEGIQTKIILRGYEMDATFL